MTAPKPCPFCGSIPAVEPIDWRRSGDAWARVVCKNRECPVKPGTNEHPDDIDGVTGEANSMRCKDMAIAKWNRAIQ